MGHKIIHKLAFVLSLPALAAAVLSGILIHTQIGVASDAAALTRVAAIAQKIGAFVHESQKERGLTALLLAGSGSEYRAELQAQRAAADARWADLDSGVQQLGTAVDEHYRAAFDKIAGTLDAWTALRKDVDLRAIPAADAIAFYSEMNSALLDLIDQTARQSSNAQLSLQVLAYANLQRSKEFAGIERAILANVFRQDDFGDNGLYPRFIATIESESNHERQFLSLATPAQADFYRSSLNTAEIAEAFKLRARALEQAQAGGFGVDGAHWFGVKTAQIDALKKVDDRVAADLTGAAQSLRDTAHNHVWLLGVSLVIGLGVVLAVSVITVRGLSTMVAALHDVIARIAHSLDLNVRIPVLSKDELGAVAVALNGMLDKFHEGIQLIFTAADHVASTATQLTAISGSTSDGLARQQSETEQVATAVNEMNATVHEIAGNANRTAGATREAERQSTEGVALAASAMRSIDDLKGEIVNASSVIQKLENDANKIGVVVDVIKQIAEQTNLLALNAAIEAARAGESGRGFAVVADEVRSLATRTQHSTSEIQAVIEELQKEARDAVQNIEKAGNQAEDGVVKMKKTERALAAIKDQITEISDMNTQIATASEEQSAVTDEINRNIVRISQLADETVGGSNETAQASEELLGMGERLKGFVGQFKI